MSQQYHILGVDCQMDFTDPSGALFVNGSPNDMKRFGELIFRLTPFINDIHMTMDSHAIMDIAHPSWWIDIKGKHPAPFTAISSDDVKNGVWRPYNPKITQRMIEYVNMLEINKRYMLVIWPEHCITGTPGWCFNKDIYPALSNWCRVRKGVLDIVTKGSNAYTEHYSAVVADVPDPNDPSTGLNMRLINILQNAANENSLILIGGEASSHCVANTIRDISNNFGEDGLKNLVLLEDAMSPVTGFESLAIDFFNDMRGLGLQIAKTSDF